MLDFFEWLQERLGWAFIGVLVGFGICLRVTLGADISQNDEGKNVMEWGECDTEGKRCFKLTDKR